MLHRLLADSAGHFWQQAEFENVVNPDFENLKHLQNPGRLYLAKPSMLNVTYVRTRRKYYCTIWSIVFQLTSTNRPIGLSTSPTRSAGLAGTSST